MRVIASLKLLTVVLAALDIIDNGENFAKVSLTLVPNDLVPRSVCDNIFVLSATPAESILAKDYELLFTLLIASLDSC
jgi:hypothetical protein